MITASYAADQGRDVFAVPGSIFQAGGCLGTNRLIRDGATPIVAASDVLEALNLMSVPQQVEAHMLFPTDATKAVLLDQLAGDPTHVDSGRRATGLPIATVTSTLALMELKGMVRHTGGMSYIRPGSRAGIPGRLMRAAFSCSMVVRLGWQQGFDDKRLADSEKLAYSCVLNTLCGGFSTMLYAVIMAGGSGTRLWPLSRKS